VERAGDVIPYISDSKPGDNRTPIVIPPCPVCGSELAYVDPQLACSNDECGGKLLNKLSDAVIRIGIDRLGKPTIQKMIDTLNVEDLTDVFNLTMEDISKLPGFAETSTKNLFNEINKVKKNGVYEWQILACLNIPGIGRSLSKDLLNDRDFAELSLMTESELKDLDGIGPERAKYISEGIRGNFEYVRELFDILPINKPATPGPTPSHALRVCFTGKFPEKKSYYYEILKERGDFVIMDKVTKDTQMLVVADPSKESNKTKAAKKKGIKIVGIDELI
jgi:DNA ligase (NAD+)